MKSKLQFVMIITTIIICLSLFCSCVEQTDYNGFALGTAYSVKLNKGISHKDIEELLDSIEQRLSVSIEESDIYKINNSNANEWVEIAPSTMALITESFRYAQMDAWKNAFNITLFPLIQLWGFDPPFLALEQKAIPDEAKIGQLLDYASSDYFEISGNKIKRLNDNAALDLGGVAKGYAADVLADFLKKKNAKGIINLGGTIVSLGKKSIIGVEPPRDSDFYYILSFELQADETCATSGDYQRYYTIDGERYHHILGKDGYPVDNGLMSVTIICDSAQKADILSTTVFVEGTSAVEAIKSNNAKAIMVLKDKTVITVGIDIEIKDPSYTVAKIYE